MKTAMITDLPPNARQLEREFNLNTYTLACLQFRQESKRLGKMFREWRAGHIEGRVVTLQHQLVKQCWRTMNELKP